MTVLVEAVHTVKPLTNTAFDAYVAWYGDAVMPALRRNGFDVLGAWKRWGGPMGQDVLLSRFESVAAYDQASRSLRSDAEFGKAVGSAGRDFQVAETVKMATVVPYATEQRLERALSEKPEAPRQYMQAILNVKMGAQPRAYDAVGKLADMVEGGQHLNLVTAYETSIGMRGELTDIWVLPSGPLPMAYRAGDPLAELMTDLRKAAPEESTYYLNPLPYSPLQ